MKAPVPSRAALGSTAPPDGERRETRLPLSTILVTVLSAATICVLMYHFWQTMPRFGPQPANLDLALDLLQIRAQQINGLSLNGSWSYSLAGFYSGPFYIWSMAIGGIAGSAVLGQEYYYYSGYVFSQLLVIAAMLWSIRQAQRWLKGLWAAGFCVSLLFMMTVAVNQNTGGFSPYLTVPSWGPAVSSGMFVAAFMLFIVYSLSRRGLGGLLLFSGLAFQTHGMVEVPVAIMLVLPLYDVVRGCWGRSITKSLYELRWAISGAVLGWGVLVLHIARDGVHIILPTRSLVGVGGSAAEHLRAAGAQIGVGGAWICIIVPVVVSVIAIVAGVVWRQFARVSFALVAMSGWVVGSLALFSYSDNGAHVTIWYIASVYLVAGSAAFYVFGSVLLKVFKATTPGWGNVLGGVLALVIAINPLGLPLVLMNPSFSFLHAPYADGMRKLGTNLPAGDLNFIVTGNNRGESDPVIAAAQTYGHRVCRVQRYLSPAAEAITIARFTCPHGELKNGRWLLVVDTERDFGYRGRTLVEAKVGDRVYRVLEVPKDIAGPALS